MIPPMFWREKRPSECSDGLEKSGREDLNLRPHGRRLKFYRQYKKSQNFGIFRTVIFRDHYDHLCNGCAIMPKRPKHYSGGRRRGRDTRPSAARRGYDSRWRRLRMFYLKRHPLCENPFGYDDHVTPATDVDHIIPRRNGGPDSFDNLQSLCHACHSRKTRLEQQGKLDLMWNGWRSIEQAKMILQQFGQGGGGQISGSLSSETAGEVKRARQADFGYSHPEEDGDE